MLIFAIIVVIDHFLSSSIFFERGLFIFYNLDMLDIVLIEKHYRKGVYTMKHPELIDPRKMYYHQEFPNQEQDTPALQNDMQPEPDCGETSYVGAKRLKIEQL